MFPSTERVGTNISSIIWQLWGWTICPTGPGLGWKKMSNVHIVHCSRVWQMAEDERRAKLWMLLIDCLFYCFFSCVIHHQYPGLLQGGGRVWFSCMNVAFLLFPLNFPLSLSSDTFLWKHISNFDRATKIFTARRKLSLLWKLPSNHVTLFTGPHEKLSKTVGRMHGS